MYIISATDFKFPFEVPNTNEAISNSGSQLNMLIDSKVRLCLQMALGHTEFKSLDADIVNGELKTDAAQRWKDFVNGKEYQVNGKGYKWIGLNADYGANKVSLLVNFVYYYWLESTATRLNGTSQGTGKAKNVTPTNYIPNAVEAWNAFVAMYQGDYFMKQPRPLFDYWFTRLPYFYSDWYHGSCIKNDTGYVSMLRYLHDNRDVYPDASLEVTGLINSLGF